MAKDVYRQLGLQRFRQALPSRQKKNSLRCFAYAAFPHNILLIELGEQVLISARENLSNLERARLFHCNRVTLYWPDQHQYSDTNAPDHRQKYRMYSLR